MERINYPAEIAKQTLTVSQAATLLNGILDPLTLVVEGEVSGFKINQNRFVYFNLKDQSSALGCFMMLFQLPFKLEDGMMIKVVAKPGLHAPSGRFSLTIRSLELVGEGALQKAFEQLKEKLTKEGLFDDKWKKPLPFFPKTIGIITSATGDALHDIQRILKNRAGGLKVILAPVAVQGQNAVEEISAAIRYFNAYCPVEVLIIARGGGSLEDLQAFNSEPVVRAVFASKIPVITGVGHEPDITLIDLAADRRAATPTNAAEIAVPDYLRLDYEIEQTARQLTVSVQGVVVRQKKEAEALAHRLRQSLNTPIRQTDRLRERLFYLLTIWQRRSQHYRESTGRLSDKLLRRTEDKIREERQNLNLISQKLEGLSPFRILERGYALATDENGQIIKKSDQLPAGHRFRLRLTDGTIKAQSLGEEQQIR